MKLTGRATKTGCKESTFKIFEKEKDSNGKDFYPCVIISEGMGNLKDRNYYTSSFIESAVPVYEGAQAYIDHQTDEEQMKRPGRSVKELAGHYEDCKAVKANGLTELRAKFYPIEGKEDVTSLVEHSLKYKKKYPEKDFIGVSINGDGEGVSMDYEEFIKEVSPPKQQIDKIKSIEGQSINVITLATEAFSADLVTSAGARGRLGEENKKQKNKEKLMKLIENFRKLLLGIEKGDTALREEAVKGMLQTDDGDSDDQKKKEAEEKSEADSMVKHMLQAKKELKKEDGESDEAYEAKCMKQAFEKHKAEKKEAAEKSEKEKKEADEKEKSEKEKKEAAPADDKKKDDKSKDGDKGHDDAAQDKELIKKMMGEIEGLKKEMSELKKGKEEAEKEAVGAKESAAKANIELKTKERAQLVDRVLAESGLPRYVTTEIRGVIEKCKTEKEMRETVKTLSEAHAKAIEETFSYVTNTGNVERAPDVSNSGTDDLF